MGDKEPSPMGLAVSWLVIRENLQGKCSLESSLRVDDCFGCQIGIKVVPRASPSWHRGNSSIPKVLQPNCKQGSAGKRQTLRVAPRMEVCRQVLPLFQSCRLTRKRRSSSTRECQLRVFGPTPGVVIGLQSLLDSQPYSQLRAGECPHVSSL
jgi:hypothetical protein